MGHFKDDVERLCGEIRSLRESRQQFIQGVRASVVSLRRAASEMRSSAVRSHAEMAREARARRMEFLSHLKSSVGSRRKEFADDLAGARRAWGGQRS